MCVLVGFLPCIALGREGGEGERTLIETRGGGGGEREFESVSYLLSFSVRVCAQACSDWSEELSKVCVTCTELLCLLFSLADLLARVRKRCSRRPLQLRAVYTVH